jgi:PEP-utilising enzyme, PEP-binding domain
VSGKLIRQVLESVANTLEQVSVYTRVFEAFGARRVVVRTLDAGADKPLAFASLGPEANPAWVDGGCGARPSAQIFWTPSSRRSPQLRGPPALMCG